MPDGFGRLAWVYEALERLVYGDLLQRARLSLLSELTEARHILILGEGDGRFLLALLQRHETCRVTVQERSAGMLKRAQARIAGQLPEALARVTFRHEDALEIERLQQSYDALVTNFFLDVFDDDLLPRLTEKLAACLGPGGLWLLSDFASPSAVEAGWPRLLSRLLLPLMYNFFRVTTQLPAGKLTPPQPFMVACGLELKGSRHFRGGFVYAERWQKEVRRDSTG